MDFLGLLRGRCLMLAGYVGLMLPILFCDFIGLIWLSTLNRCLGNNAGLTTSYQDFLIGSFFKKSLVWNFSKLRFGLSSTIVVSLKSQKWSCTYFLTAVTTSRFFNSSWCFRCFTKSIWDNALGRLTFLFSSSRAELGESRVYSFSWKYFSMSPKSRFSFFIVSILNFVVMHRTCTYAFSGRALTLWYSGDSPCTCWWIYLQIRVIGVQSSASDSGSFGLNVFGSVKSSSAIAPNPFFLVLAGRAVVLKPPTPNFEPRCVARREAARFLCIPFGSDNLLILFSCRHLKTIEFDLILVFLKWLKRDRELLYIDKVR